MQKRLLKRFIEKQVSKLRQLSDSSGNATTEESTALIEGQLETFNELLAAHKELVELTCEH